jgi:TnpA family transposase
MRTTYNGRPAGSRIAKSLFLLSYLDDESYRRRALHQINRQEGRHRLARAVFYGQKGELRQRYREGQEDQLSALGLVLNLLILWNTCYTCRFRLEIDPGFRATPDPPPLPADRRPVYRLTGNSAR